MAALIFCAGSNRHYAARAMMHGFLYGVASNRCAYWPPAFVDLDYRAPNFAAHLATVEHWRPRFAIAGDAEDANQLARVLDQAAALEPFAAQVIVVPKAPRLVERIPDRYLVGLSVPTRFGATQAPYWEYRGRRVHLLGGTPHAQLTLARYLDVVSADGNSTMKAAAFGDWWEHGHWARPQKRSIAGKDSPYVAFERSCVNIAAAWARLAQEVT